MALDLIRNKKILRPIQGLILSLGAPSGWLVIQELFGVNPFDDVINHPAIYIYLSFGTALAFLIFGLYVGTYEKKIEEQALVDSLTGLGNRNKFYLFAEYELERSFRYQDRLSLALMDIDHFKNINDTYGHNTGDHILINVAKKIRATLRKSDISVRWGGEEFLFLMPGTSLAESREISERLRNSIEAGPYQGVSRVTVSIGLTEYTKGDSLDSMIKRADEALYEVKNSGRNRVSTKPP